MMLLRTFFPPAQRKKQQKKKNFRFCALLGERNTEEEAEEKKNFTSSFLSCNETTGEKMSAKQASNKRTLRFSFHANAEDPLHALIIIIIIISFVLLLFDVRQISLSTIFLLRFLHRTLISCSLGVFRFSSAQWKRTLFQPPQINYINGKNCNLPDAMCRFLCHWTSIEHFFFTRRECCALESRD